MNQILQDGAWPMLSLPFLESLYADYLRDPDSLSPSWRRYFEQVGDGSPESAHAPGAQVHAHGAQGSSAAGLLAQRPDAISTGREVTPRQQRRHDHEVAALQDRVDQLVRAYRVRGHMAARLDPLSEPSPMPPELDPAFYGLTEEYLHRPISSRTVGGRKVRTLRELVRSLQNTYCRTIGVQFMHIDDLDIRHWLQERMEGSQNRIQLSPDEQMRVLTLLTRAVVFEEFVQKKYVGAKTFSLEGCESLIPLLDTAIEKAGEHEVDEIVLAMAHRGRLNVLVNIIGKPAQEVFREFEDTDPRQEQPGGDVKYHLGHSTDRQTLSGQRVHLSLCFNPSHLEFVNPVALGRVRAKQDRVGDRERRRGMALLIHGDASFAGQGVVQETLNLSELEAYRTGGAVHVIVNNQLGFTTPPSEARSSDYATAVAKMLQIPIFHVNGEDPEGVTQVITLAMEFRRRFQRDVVIDMYGYRRHGHNETDEPSYTQPLLYRKIRERPSVRDGYLENMLKLGGVTRAQADKIAEMCRGDLDRELSVARSDEYGPGPMAGQGIWEGYRGGPDESIPEVDTSVDRERLVGFLDKLAEIPDTFHLHPRLEKLMERRREMAAGARPIDWATAEALAFASLAVQGVPIRLTGQDTARGTFSQRHAQLHDVENGSVYEPLQHLSPEQAPVTIRNSPLSEAGVLGFEYGYSLDYPEGLIAWEAQFGDFVNAAQVIIDQFIAAAEIKWRRLSGLVLLLPHGLEGQGPEHASARLERFLTLSAQDNVQVVNLTMPAQYFHLLRRQVLRPWRKPLVIMTPKSLLRHAAAVSDLDELATRTFSPVLGDPLAPPTDVKRILLCSGKIYYELIERRTKLDRRDIAILRLEQLHPFPQPKLETALKAYKDGTPAVWVQEEPENMGAWRYLRCRVGEQLMGRLPLSGVYRPASAAPATGSTGAHKQEQQRLIELAFSNLT